MKPDAIERIQSLTPQDYVEAFQRISLTDHQCDMLRIHYAAPGFTLSVRHLARGLGYSRWSASNLHYGRLAHRVCDAMGLQPSTKLSIFVEFFKQPGEEYQLTLRPAVVTALELSGIVSGADKDSQEEAGFDTPLVEGASYFVQVSAFERNPVAKEKCKAHYGVRCVVCGFDFEKVYGPIAVGYIHVHHLMPLASIGQEYVIDPIADLRPVCANCHAVIHLRKAPYSIEEMRALLSVASSE